MNTAVKKESGRRIDTQKINESTTPINPAKGNVSNMLITIVKLNESHS